VLARDVVINSEGTFGSGVKRCFVFAPAESLPGPEGQIGPGGLAGRTILSGVGPPGLSLGSTAGDFYIDTGTDELYGPAAFVFGGFGGLNWGNPRQLKGPKGDAGAAGDVGPAGPAGPNPAIGGAVTGLTPGSVLFGGVGGALAQDNASLKYDLVAKRLFAGTSLQIADGVIEKAPGFPFAIGGTVVVGSLATGKLTGGVGRANCAFDVDGGSKGYIFYSGASESNEILRIGSTGLLTLQNEIRGRARTVAELAAITPLEGLSAYCSNEAGGAVPVFADGTNWRRATDRAIVS